MKTKPTLTVLFCLFAGLVQAQPRTALYGAKIPINKTIADFAPVAQPAGYRARLYLSNPGGGEFRLFFDNIVAGSERFDLSLITGVGEVGRISSEDLTAHATFASNAFRAGNFTIEITAPTAPANLNFRISELAYEVKGAGALSIAGGRDERKEVASLPVGDHMRISGRSVAKLEYRDAAGVDRTCTGFLVAPDQLLTNYHCLGDPQVCESAVAIFGYLSDDAAVEQVRCRKLIKADTPADPDSPPFDFALVQLDGRPGDRWNMLKLALKGPARNAHLYMPQHPNGRPQEVSFIKCSVTSPAVKGLVERGSDFSNSCDTEEGASGSPLLDVATDEVVGLHHLGFTSDFADVNRAVRIEKIRAAIYPP